MPTAPRKRGNSWNCQVRVTGHKHESVSAPTKAEVRMLAAERERELRAGEVNADTKATFGALLDKYLLTDEHNRRATAGQIEKNLEQWRERFGHLLIGHVRSGMVADARDEMLSTLYALSDDTVRGKLNQLSGFFRWCMRERKAVKSNPVADVTKPPEGPGRERYLTGSERTRLFAACKETSSKILYPLVVLACYTGMRRGEMIDDLRWCDLNLEKESAFVRRSKNGSKRHVPVKGPALAAMREWADSHPDAEPDSLVFNNAHFPQEAWKKALFLAGVEDFRFHDLRHTAGSQMKQSGADIADIADFLGHKTLKMTRRYSHHSSASMDKLVERMVAFSG